MSEKSEVLAAEVVGKEGESKLVGPINMAVKELPDNFLMRDEAEGIRDDIEFCETLQQKAAWTGLRIGLTLLKIKREIPHGEFMEWRNVVCGTRCSFATRMMQLAEAFLHAKHVKREEAFLLTSDEFLELPSAEKAPKYAQLAFDFTEDLPLSELCRRYGISGYDRPASATKDGGEKAPAEPRDVMREAELEWSLVMNTLYNRGVQKKSWARMSHEKIVTLFELTDTLLGEMRPVVEAIRKAEKGTRNAECGTRTTKKGGAR